MNKIKNLEFLKILGMFAVVFYHMFLKTGLYNPDCNIVLFRKMHYMTSHGCLAVELFFILSGFFFAVTYKANDTVWNFVKKKFIRLFPVMLFVTLLYGIIAFCGIGHFSFYDNILSLSFLYGMGINSKTAPFTYDTLCNLDHLWYVSTMFWGLLLIFYLRKTLDKKQVNLIISILVFVSYIILLNLCSGKITHFYHAKVDIGFLRALGGLGIGYFIGNWYCDCKQKLLKLNCNFKTKCALSALEIYCLYFLINNLILHNFKYYNNFIFVIFFIVTIILFLIKQGFVSNLLSNSIVPRLSKYCYSIYVSHMVVIMFMRGYIYQYQPVFITQHPAVVIAASLFLIICLGYITYNFVEKTAIEKFLKR